MPLNVTDSLWRAQLGCEEDKSPPLDEDGSTLDIAVAFCAARMVPNVQFASDGRVSPRGVVTLYAALDEATAVAEVRPHVGAAVTLAEFRAQRPLRLVDCHKDHDRSPFWSISGKRSPIAEAWIELNRAFARPLYDLARTDLYAPTQIVSEWFRRAGFDGLAFKSSLGPGINVALFDVQSARLVRARVVEVDSIRVGYHDSQFQREWQDGD
jgi:hypothetical protein